jgi:hypothetical protein
MKAGTLLLLFVLGAAVVSNPDRDSFVSWVKSEAAAQAGDGVQRALAPLVAEGLLAMLPIERKNYAVCSIVTLTVPISGEKYHFLGAFGHWWEWHHR